MKVILKRSWFAPSDSRRLDALRSVSGQRFRKGENEIPDEFRSLLPSDAVIVGEPSRKEGKKPVMRRGAKESTLKNFDIERNETPEVPDEE